MLGIQARAIAPAYDQRDPAAHPNGAQKKSFEVCFTPRGEAVLANSGNYVMHV
jgi:hypothetical protein